MAKYKLVVFLFLVVYLLTPPLVSAQSPGAVVGQVGGENITYKELHDNYAKGSAEIDLAELQQFLPLYLDYKAKLLFAKDNGYYQDAEILAEHEMYAKQAAYAYWLNEEIRPELFDLYYNRALVELKTFHILIATTEFTSPQEIDSIKKRLQQAKTEIENGADLAEVDAKYSTKRNGLSMGGEIPWISAGRTVKEYEDQAYALQPGQISEPFKTQFGYHIVLLLDKRERTPSKLIRHIYVQPTEDSTAYNKINEAYNALQNNIPWNEVVTTFTEDGASIRNGGQIGWVDALSGYSLSFFEHVYQLEGSLPYSAPVKTNYGFHILKVDSVQTFDSEESHRAYVMREFEQSNYFQESNAFAVNYLKNKYGDNIHHAALEAYKSAITRYDTLRIEKINVPAAHKDKALYTFNKKEYTVSDFHTYVQKNHGNRPAKSYSGSWINDFSKYIIDSTILELTLLVYPEFRQQLESYLNGLIVYKLNDDYIWSATTVDTSRLQSIYEKNPAEYRFPERPYYYTLSAAHDSTLHSAMRFITAGNSPDSVRANIKNIAVSSDSLNAFQEAPYDKLNNLVSGDFSEIFELNRRKAIFYLVDWLPARNMSFDEAFSRLLTEFQPTRESEWMDEIRKKYRVRQNLNNLNKAFKASQR